MTSRARRVSRAARWARGAEFGAVARQAGLAILAFDLKANGIDLGQEKLTMEKAGQLTIPR